MWHWKPGNPPHLWVCLNLELRDHFILVQFHSGSYAADAHVGAVIIVSPQPLCGVILHLLNAVKDIHPEPFITHCPIAPLDISVLLRLAGLDVA